MNLHAIVAPVVGAVNPNQTVTVFTSIGSTTAADGSQTPTYATPAALTASVGASAVGSAVGTTLTVTSLLYGLLSPGDVLSGSDGTNALPADATILSQLSGGTIGGTGVYLLSDAPALLNSCTLTGSSTVLTVTAVTAGVLLPGQTLFGTGTFVPGTIITGQLSGSTGGVGTYSLSDQQNLPPAALTTHLILVAQVQALTGGDLRHMDMLNLQGSHRTLYASSNIRGAVRPALRGGDIVQLPDTSVWLVTQVMEPFFDTAGWQKVVITLQDTPAPSAPAAGLPAAVDYYVTEDSVP